jgi:acetylornithine deacetylase
MKEDVSKYIDRDWITRITKQMVEIPSRTLDEAAICDFYAKEIEKIGLAIDKRQVSGNRYNIYAKLQGLGSGPSLALNGHLDTIPIGIAWPPKIDNHRIYGRGSEDMKGGMVAILAAVKALIESKTTLSGDLWITAVVGHEDSEAAKDGPIAMSKDLNEGRIRCDSILIAEGDSELWTMSTGSAVFSIKLFSKLNGTHTNNLPFKDNPIKFVGKVIEAVSKLQETMDTGPRHPLIGNARIDLGKIESGDYYNRVPKQSNIEGIVRWLPGTSFKDVKLQIENLVAPIANAGDLDFRVDFSLEREPFEVLEEDQGVKSAFKAIELVTGRQPKIIGKKIVGDANIFMGTTNIPTFYFGPGYQTAHSDTEWVEIDALVTAARVYAHTAINFCGISC